MAIGTKASGHNAVVEARFSSSSSNRLWKKPHLSVVGAGERNIDRQTCMCDRCLPSKKYCAQSIVRSNCDGFNGLITFGRQFGRCRERQIPANLWICRRNFGEAFPRSPQKEQHASTPESCCTDSQWIAHCRNMDESKVCFSPLLLS